MSLMSDQGLETKMRENARLILLNYCVGLGIANLERQNELVNDISIALLDVARKGDEYRIQLEAWQKIFGTSQLSHAQARLEAAEQQLVQARAEIERLRQWVNDLQSGMYINCVYCGHCYGPNPGTPIAMADILRAHIEKCPEHPMSTLRADLERAQKQMRTAEEALQESKFFSSVQLISGRIDAALEALTKKE